MIHSLFITDDNGITGPDWGRSGVVFRCILPDPFHLPGPLWRIAAAYSSLQRFRIMWFHYSIILSFVNAGKNLLTPSSLIFILFL